MIILAKQDGNTVRVYNERNFQIFNKYGILMGYTGSTVSIKDTNGNTIRTYDEKGMQISCH